LTQAKTRGSFICPKVLIADRGISRHITDGTFSNGHCGTATGLNVIWIQRLIMKRKERKQCSVPVESMLRIRKERITYRCLVLPPSPRIIHVSLIEWIITPAPPRNGRTSLLCGSRHIGKWRQGERIRGKGGTSAARPFYPSEAVCCIRHLQLVPYDMAGTRYKNGWIITVISRPISIISHRRRRDDPEPETSLAEERTSSQLMGPQQPDQSRPPCSIPGAHRRLPISNPVVFSARNTNIIETTRGNKTPQPQQDRVPLSLATVGIRNYKERPKTSRE